MTTRIKELDGSRSVEIERKGGDVYVDSGTNCFQFDVAIFLRAIEREFGVTICPLVCRDQVVRATIA